MQILCERRLCRVSFLLQHRRHVAGFLSTALASLLVRRVGETLRITERKSQSLHRPGQISTMTDVAKSANNDKALPRRMDPQDYPPAQHSSIREPKKLVAENPTI